MRKLSSILIVTALVAACEKKSDEAAKLAEADKKPAEQPTEAEKPAEPEQQAGDTEAIIAGMKAFSEGNYDESAKPFAEDIKWIDVGSPEDTIEGKQAVKDHWKKFHAAFPDGKLTPVRLIDTGDQVVVQAVVTGTHKGELDGLAPTEKKIGFGEFLLAKFEDGKITEMKVFADDGAMLAQLGQLENMPVPPVQQAPTGEPEIIEGEPNDAALTAIKTYTEGFEPDSFEEASKNALAENIKARDAGTGDDVQGREAMQKEANAMFEAFPDFSIEEVEVLGAGDWAVAISRATGTHKGALGPIEATGKPIDVEHAEVCRAEGDKLVECWSYMNSAAMMAQLGLTPGPENVAQK